MHSRLAHRCAVLVVTVSLSLLGAAAGAAAASAQPTSSGSSCLAASTGSPTTRPTVSCASPAKAQLGDMLTLTVQNLSALVGPNGDGTNCTGSGTCVPCSSLVLFLNGFPISGIDPSRCDPDDGHVGFLLSRNASDANTWNSLLGGPRSFTKNLTVAIGPSSTRSIPQALDGQPGQDVTVQFSVVPKAQFWIFVVIAIGLLAAVVLLGTRTALLRDPGGDPNRPARNRPFSLSRTQQAFWVVLVLLGYVFVYLVTSNLNSLSSSALLLIAISSGTAFGGQIMTTGHATNLAAKLRTLKERQATERTKTTLAKIDAEIASTQRVLQKDDSKGFLADLLYDDDGVSLQRLQIIAWTVTLGCIFVNEVYSNLTMPEFSATLLTLMGLSSGTYLAGKSKELNAATVTAASADAKDANQ